MQCHTQAFNIITDIKVKIDFNLTKLKKKESYMVISCE